ncbi:hypothetical protein BLS_001903 [Venturia inaequalis]|uniref:Uncharacterized protein n=1 Tax=Venturia inaequalis TaxID=5025 RepID=A0A8H3UN86_VENIN|nr:hypothetical protein EG328_004886 [Venturia inaequalis]KAE9976696.1 hypothetical protein BLS_001903 [Venturia inaequalis]KAE9979802.1 hypothetical protein EG327_006895 [Venturia inaequalis]RDI88585.1 hypothetical protein Vi05172_g985 [Venturia inaequalis]
MGTTSSRPAPPSINANDIKPIPPRKPAKSAGNNFFSLPLEIRQNILLRTYNPHKSRLAKAAIAKSLHPGEPHSPHCDIWAKVGGHKVKARIARHARQDLADVKAQVDKLGRVHDLVGQDMSFVEETWRQKLCQLQDGMENELVEATTGCVHWNNEWHRLRRST